MNSVNLPEERTIMGHPKGLYILFLTEMWERFSFYGMKALLIFYLTKYHLFSDAAGGHTLGSYLGLGYALPVIGGLLADRYLGMRKAVIFGAILLCLGHLGMAFEGRQAIEYAAGSVLSEALTLADGSILAAGTVLTEKVVIQDNFAIQVFYFSLALIIVGIGFLKPNISTIVGRLYAEDDPRRDGGFTIFYMGINLGAFLATIICGWLGEKVSWAWGFGAAGIGMLFGLAVFLWGQKYLNGLAEPTNPEKLKEKVFAGINREWLIYLCGIASLFIIWQMVQRHEVVGLALASIGAAVFIWLVYFLAIKCNSEERSRMIVLMILIVFSVIFWALFEQSGSSMNLFADRIIDRNLFGTEIPASQFQSLNALFIFILAPVFAWLWLKLSQLKLEPNTPVKFGLALIQVGLGFGALVIGSSMPNAAGQVAAIWLVLAYLLHTTGELCLSPVGLSAVTKLSVQGVVGVMMGTWFLATAGSEFVAHTIIAPLASVDTSGGEITDIGEALNIYSSLFESLTYVGVGFGVLLILFSPLLKKGMKGVH